MSFDPLRYIASYPDLIAAFGLDTAAATNHYNSVGVFEGRVPSFDALRYVASNPDLIAYFGLDATGATTHYIANGRAEGRQLSFDALRYIASNPDLIAAFGLDATAATTHYIANGFAEGRQANFDALRYIASNPDLIAYFGLNTSAATTHYIANGFAEGRQLKFDALRYIASNPDLIAAFGLDLTAATTHYIANGFAEGRSAAGFDAAAYLRNHADLRAAFGSDLVAATQHYIGSGFAEGRQALPLTVDLSRIAAGTGGFVINGQCVNDSSGSNIAIAGDVNGDGLDDVIISAYNADPSGRTNAGRSFVVFGKTGQAAVDLAAVAAGSGGFVINGQGACDNSGRSVSTAGDVNGDGLADLIIGAPSADPAAGSNAGRSHVVFGKAGTAAVELSDIAAGTGGFVINGQGASDTSGFSVAQAGDVNGDGMGDLVVGARLSDPPAGRNAGRGYVIFGRSDGTSIELSGVAAGNGGFVINGQGASDESSAKVAGAGDVNGDGLADVIVGARLSDPAAGSSAGRAYVVFGKLDNTPVDLSSVAAGVGGFVINGQCAADRTGNSVAGAGDVNGDGLADLVVGAYFSNPLSGGYAAGSTFVVFGQTAGTPIDLSRVAAGTGGFVIHGQCSIDESGVSVANAGDLNGDGLTDLVVSAWTAEGIGGNYAGRSYVVFGKTGTAVVELSNIAAGDGGFVINGSCAYDFSSIGIGGGGDLDGDGLSDLVVGAPQLTLGLPGLPERSGRGYVVFGATTGVFNRTAVDQLGDAGNNHLTGTLVAETLVGGAGDDIIAGGGGADVLYGGAGDDTLVVGASTVAALASVFGSGGNTTQLARVDGGTGIDTLKLEGAGLVLDLTTIANQGAATPGSRSRLEAIERIDITGSGNNTLVLGLKDVIDLASFNSFNNATGWLDGTYDLATGGANPERRRQLVVDADAGDVVNLSGWSPMGTVTNSGTTYAVYHQGSFAELLIDARATVVLP